MTSSLRGGSEIMTHDDKGGGGVKNCQNGGDVICGWPLRRRVIILHFIRLVSKSRIFFLKITSVTRRFRVKNTLLLPKITPF